MASWNRNSLTSTESSDISGILHASPIKYFQMDMFYSQMDIFYFNTSSELCS